MTFINAQVRLMRTTELPEDLVVNTFSFITGSAVHTAADLDAIETSLIGFYNVVGAGGSALTSHLSNLLSVAALKNEIRLYDINAPAASPPLRTRFWTLATTASSPLPAEVALCLSFKAPAAVGQNPKRQRGRVYIGPISTGSLNTASTGGDARPSVPCQTAIIDAGNRLMTDTGHAWSVWSRRDATATNPNGTLVPITDLWVDNAWDTQRRRGARPSTRITRTSQV
jgi:hypothetical protein